VKKKSSARLPSEGK